MKFHTIKEWQQNKDLKTLQTVALIACLIMIFIMLPLIMATTVKAQEKGIDVTECQDPKNLKGILKEAYYELQEISESIEGMKVDILCTKRYGFIAKKEKVDGGETDQY